MKFNRRVGREGSTWPGVPTTGTLRATRDILDWSLSRAKALIPISALMDIKTAAVDDIDHLGNRRVRSVGEMAENTFRVGLVRVERAVKERLTLAETDRPDAAGPDQRQAGGGRDEGVLRFQPAVAVHGPEQPAVGSDPQAPRLGAWAGRPDPRTRRLRSARRAPDPLWPRVPDRNAGRSEHRSDQLAGGLCAHQRIRLPRNAVPQGDQRQGHRRDRIPVGDRRRRVRHRPGQRRPWTRTASLPTSSSPCRHHDEFTHGDPRPRSNTWTCRRSRSCRWRLR